MRGAVNRYKGLADIERGFRALKSDIFVRSEAGGKAAAIAYTLIETAKLNAIDPYARLADTLARFPDNKITEVDDLLRWIERLATKRSGIGTAQ